MSDNHLRLHTLRLELVAATAEMLEADLCGRKELSESLKAEVPEAWPPVNWDPGAIEYLINWMRKRPDAPGWFAWYCLQRRTDLQSVNSTISTPNPPIKPSTGQITNLSYEKPSTGQINNLSYEETASGQITNLSYDTLIGGLGFLGPPNSMGETAVGYSLLSNFHRQGYCPEALTALIDWAFAHSELKTLIIRTPRSHRPSIRVAEKLHFEFAGPGPEQDTVEYALDRAGWLLSKPDCSK